MLLSGPAAAASLASSSSLDVAIAIGVAGMVATIRIWASRRLCDRRSARAVVVLPAVAAGSALSLFVAAVHVPARPAALQAVAVVAVALAVLLCLPGLPTPAGVAWRAVADRSRAHSRWHPTDFGLTARLLALAILAGTGQGWSTGIAAAALTAGCLVARQLDRRQAVVPRGLPRFIAEIAAPVMQLRPDDRVRPPRTSRPCAYAVAQRDGRARLVDLTRPLSSDRPCWEHGVPADGIDGARTVDELLRGPVPELPVLVYVGELIVGVLDQATLIGSQLQASPRRSARAGHTP